MSSANLVNIKYIDCHSHPHDVKYKNEGVNVDKVLNDLRLDGGATIAIGTDFKLSCEALALAKKHDNVWCTIGVHPADNHAESFDDRFEELYLENKEKIVGVGECGLDYYYFEKTYGKDWKESEDCKKEVERQTILFKQQIEFAIKYDLPLVLHGRPSKNSMDAYRDMLDILGSYLSTSSGPSASLRGHAHFFVGNLEVAKRFLELDFLVSFDGPITFTKEYDEVIKFLPIESIMIETDSPYAAPTPHRGQINYPTYVKEVAKKIAELKNLTVDEVLEITKNNAIKLFKLT
jgi:TatD DNase family protein